MIFTTQTSWPSPESPSSVERRPSSPTLTASSSPKWSRRLNTLIQRGYSCDRYSMPWTHSLKPVASGVSWMFAVDRCASGNTRPPHSSRGAPPM